MGLLGLMLFSSCQDNSTVIYANQRLIHIGDNMDWTDPKWDDSDWDQRGSTSEIGQFWVRFHIQFDDRINLLNHKGIHMISLGSYEAYWDGIKIHENGKVGQDKKSEKEGQFISQILIPDSLCQIGPHVLALRLSNYHNKAQSTWSWNTFKVEEFYHSVKNELKLTAFMFVLGGCFFLVSIYYFLLFVKEKRDLKTMVFSIMCLLFFILMLFEFMKFYWSYGYSFHDLRLVTIGWLTAIIAFVVPWFFCLHFDIPRRRIFLFILFVAIIAILWFLNIRYDSTTQSLSSTMLYSSIAISAYAVWLRRKGSILILVAFLLVAAINYFSTYNIDILIFSYDINLFLSFLILVLAILYALSQQRREQQEAYEASLLLSERIKNELLKKNIRPHFIMNTLTSVMEWVERSPQKGIEFIESLAGEFDLLNDIADEKLISIGQEIDLCKKHIEIMTFRKEVTYLWEDENVDPALMLPPAILHTIVENGITHSKVPSQGEIKFKLTQDNSIEGVLLRLEVFAENRKTKSSTGSGTGFKYIRSRLTESFGDNWTLNMQESPNGWITEIVIKQK